MRLVTLDFLNSQASLLEFKLQNDGNRYYMTNVTEHISDVYKFRNPIKGNEKSKFIIKYSGNIIKDDNHVAHYIIIKEKEASKYLLSVDVFNNTFIKI